MATALLIIDVQNAFFSMPPLADRAETVMANINLLTERARAQKTAVVWIQHHAPQMPTYSEQWALPKRLNLTSSDYNVSKNTPDAFLNTSLGSLLSAAQVTHLVICGFATECCVDTTTRSAMARGFQVTLISDAHTTHDQPHALASTIVALHNATLCAISSFAGQTQCRPTTDMTFQD